MVSSLYWDSVLGIYFFDFDEYWVFIKFFIGCQLPYAQKCGKKGNKDGHHEQNPKMHLRNKRHTEDETWYSLFELQQLIVYSILFLIVSAAILHLFCMVLKICWQSYRNKKRSEAMKRASAMERHTECLGIENRDTVMSNRTTVSANVVFIT